jgi:hypothetical protein
MLNFPTGFHSRETPHKVQIGIPAFALQRALDALAKPKLFSVLSPMT